MFSVYANGTTNGTTANTSNIGLRAVVGYTSTGFGVSGFATGATGTSFGVYAQSAPATGTGNAVRAEAWSPTSRAVLGISNINGGGIATNQQAISVFGQVNGTLAGGLASGVLGITAASMTTGDARGVTGQSASNSGTGVFGFATSTAINELPVGVLQRFITGRALRRCRTSRQSNSGQER